jgi:pyridoxine kinase
MKRAVIIESYVVEGHVGNRAATPSLQLLGYEVLTVPTVVYTCRVGWPGFAGRETAPDHLALMLDYVLTRPADITVTGYLGSPAGVAEVVKRAEDFPGTLVVDPVMGDYPGGLYVSEDVAEKIARELVPKAYAITPNRFEAEIVSGRRITTLAEALQAAEEIRTAGPEIVVITSCHHESENRACNVVAAPGLQAALYSPYIESQRAIYGAGDMFTAIFAGLLGKNIPAETAALTATAVVGQGLAQAWEQDLDTINPLQVMMSLLPLLQAGEYQKIAQGAKASIEKI